MSSYLGTLHSKSERHKKRFALLVASTATLFIFGVWSFVTFGVSDDVVAVNDESVSAALVIKGNEVSGPFQSLGTNISSSIELLKDSFEGLIGNLKAVKFDTYGQ